MQLYYCIYLTNRNTDPAIITGYTFKKRNLKLYALTCVLNTFELSVQKILIEIHKKKRK